MLDTHAVARSLTAADFTPDQVDALTDALRLVVEQGDHVTSDQFKAGLAEMRAEMRMEISTTETRLTWRMLVIAIAALLIVATATLVAGTASSQTTTASICYDEAPTWEGLCVREEPAPRTGYVRANHADSEAALILGLPANLRIMNPAGRTTAFMTPYTCKRFAVDANGKADTDIEHIVALAEAHDSGLAPSLRHALANDLDNQTVADQAVNQSKSSKDAADWTPAKNGAWFADRVIRVKRRYGLSVDRAEAEALKALLGHGSRALSCP